MDLAVAGVLKPIFGLVADIRARASTARQNKEDCLQIARRAAKLHAALAAQAACALAAATRDSALASVLEDVRLVLRDALDGVMACQADCQLFRRLVNAARVSAELRRLKKGIDDGIMDVLLVTCLYTNGLVYTMHLYHMERLRIQMHHRRMEHGGLPRPLPQLEIQEEAYGYGYTHSNQSLSNQSYAIQASPSIAERSTSGSIPCQIEWREAAIPEDVDFRREARESNIEPRVVVLLILVLLLLGARCGLERLLILYLWRLLFSLG